MPVRKTRDPVSNSGSSSHRASPTRSYVMNRLGVMKSGFWADWPTRKQNEYGQDSSYTAPKLNTLPGIDPYKSQDVEAYEGDKPTPMNMPSLNLPEESPRSSGKSAPSKTRDQLRKTEMGNLISKINHSIRSNPILSTDSLSLMTSNSINMNRQLLMAMDSSDKLLGQVSEEYFVNNPAGNVDPEATNFEKMVGAYDVTKKMAKKNINYAPQQAAKNIQKLQKQTVYQGAKMLNMGKAGGNSYSSTYYGSPFS